LWNLFVWALIEGGKGLRISEAADSVIVTSFR